MHVRRFWNVCDLDMYVGLMASLLEMSVALRSTLTYVEWSSQCCVSVVEGDGSPLGSLKLGMDMVSLGQRD
jgi:hypothetical protein